MLNETHDPALRSCVDSANVEGGDFPIQNLPHGVFRRVGSDEAFRGGVAIGDSVLDMAAACASGLFDGEVNPAAQAASAASLNGLMALGPAAWSGLRLALSRLLRTGSQDRQRVQPCLLPRDRLEHAVPAQIGDYTDFFTSAHHAFNAGRIFQAPTPLPPQFKWLPIAYHGRSSTIEVSGADVFRPWGQLRQMGEPTPLFGPTRQLDHELELGAFIGPGNRRGEPIAIDAAEDHVFGLCLLNDWSARDVQAWEAMPLGPFLAKNFLSTVSPWIVTLEALQPFRTALPREPGDPPTAPYLSASGERADGAFDIRLEAWLETGEHGEVATLLSRTSACHGYWSLAQMVSHHTEGGCSLRPGDLLGTGTQSGPAPGEEGCLLELTRGGQQPIRLKDGQTRTYLHDGDSVVLRGWCERPGHARIGFGECRGKVLPAAPR